MRPLRVLVAGSGMVGSEISRDLANSSHFSAVTVVDARTDNLRRIGPNKKIKRIKADIFDGRALARLVEDADLVCGALPGYLGFRFMKQVVSLGRDLVDISYTPEDPFRLDKTAKGNDCFLIPQCGVAPGLSNICVGDASRRLSRGLDTVRIMVGGLPRDPTPPLNYEFVFSPDDVINEYTREATIVKNGKRSQASPLSGRGELSFPSVGRLEYFLTDGLGTLPKSFSGIGEMGEYTLRYPGHAVLMDSLRVMGLLEKAPFKMADGIVVSPRKIVLEAMGRLGKRSGRGDLLAFRVDAEGKDNGSKKRRVRYQMLDYYNPRTKVTAMARTTAYTCAAVAHLAGLEMIEGKGVITPEKLGTDPRSFANVKSYLADRGVKLGITTSSQR